MPRGNAFVHFMPLVGQPDEEAIVMIELLVSGFAKSMGASWCDTMIHRNKDGAWGIRAQGGLSDDDDPVIYKRWLDRLMGVLKHGNV